MKIVIPLEDKHSTIGLLEINNNLESLKYSFFKYIKIFGIIIFIGRVSSNNEIFDTHNCKITLTKSSVDKRIKLYIVTCLKCNSILKVSDSKREAIKAKKLQNTIKCNR